MKITEEKIIRQYHIDYLRIFGVLCIIGIHASDIVVTSAKGIGEQWWEGTLIQVFVRIGLPLFFMVSGALLLNAKEESLTNFYIKRFIKILIPLFIYSLVYVFQNDFVWTFNTSIFMQGLKSILKGPVYYHLWFVYTLVGLYIAAPFLKVMMKNLSDKMLMNLIITLIVIRSIAIYVPLLGFNIGISNFIFSEWSIYFLMGYALARNHSLKVNRIVHLLGFLSFIITILILRFAPKAAINIYDLSPTMMLMAASIFLLFQNNQSFFNKKYGYRVIAFLSAYSYSIYLIHAFSLRYVNLKLGINALTVHPFVGVPLTVSLTLAISVALAFVIDNIIVNQIIKFVAFFLNRFVYKSKVPKELQT